MRAGFRHVHSELSLKKVTLGRQGDGGDQGDGETREGGDGTGRRGGGGDGRWGDRRWEDRGDRQEDRGDISTPPPSHNAVSLHFYIGPYLELSLAVCNRMRLIASGCACPEPLMTSDYCFSKPGLKLKLPLLGFLG